MLPINQETCPAREEEWTLEALGNWHEYKINTNPNEDSDYTDAGDLDQDRLHNKVNEIDTDDDHLPDPIDPDTITEGQGQTAWVVPGYDAAGNMLSGPKPGAEGTRQHYKWDAWNRMVAVYADDSGEPGDLVATYRYDGLNHRVQKIVEGAPDVTYDYYYNQSWQILEVRRSDYTYAPYEQYVWSVRYIDAPILRDRDTNDDGTLNETLHYADDANMNVTALVNTGGSVAERYTYDPYGKRTIRNPATWAEVDWVDSKKNEILYCGYYFDDKSGLYSVRHRYYHSTLGRWLSRDPIGYVEGTNLLQYVGSKPVGQQDPSGLAVTFTFHCKLVSDEIAKGDKCRRDCHYQCIETDRQLSFGGSDLPTNYPPKLVITVDTNVISWCCRITGFGTPGKCKDEFDMTRVPYGVGSDRSRAECRRACDNAYKVADALCNLDKEPITKRICKATAQGLRQMCVDSCNAVCTRP